MRRQGIKFPLSAAFVDRIGSDTLQRVRDALNAGAPKIAIQRDHKISEWALQLIELAQPELAAAHREATISGTRQAYRDNVERHIYQHGEVGREAVARAYPGAMDWLRQFDAEWLRAHIARKTLDEGNVRRRRRQWQSLDAELAARIEKAAGAELDKSTRPVRLTVSSLIKQVRPRESIRAQLLPQTVATANKHSESQQEFERRKIGWALEEYKKLNRALSMNLFRRLVWMAQGRLKQHTEYIAERAFDLGIPIDGRCAFSSEVALRR